MPQQIWQCDYCLTTAATRQDILAHEAMCLDNPEQVARRLEATLRHQWVFQTLKQYHFLSNPRVELYIADRLAKFLAASWHKYVDPTGLLAITNHVGYTLATYLSLLERGDLVRLTNNLKKKG